MSRRTDRVQDLLREELSQLISREVADPRVRLVTVTQVDVSPNLAHAKIAVSVLGEEDQRQECVAALRSASGYLRTLLARRLRLRVTPELRFSLDRGAEHSLRIAELLETSRNDLDE